MFLVLYSNRWDGYVWTKYIVYVFQSKGLYNMETIKTTKSKMKGAHA